jgi:hypothetical protein
MSRREEFFKGKPLKDVADKMAGAQPNSMNTNMARAEFLLRQTELQERATKATEDAAHYTKIYTRYMFWSVFILAISSLGSFIIAFIR